MVPNTGPVLNKASYIESWARLTESLQPHMSAKVGLNQAPKIFARSESIIIVLTRNKSAA